MLSSNRRRYPTAALIRLHKRFHNDHSPISRLHPELVLIIIDLVIGDEKYKRSLPFINSPVFGISQKWRRIALSSPLIWACIATTSSLEAKFMLERSGTCALEVIAPNASALEVLLPASRRWKHLGIGSKVTGSMFNSALLADVPNLASAVIYCEGGSIGHQLFSGTATNLRRLKTDFFPLQSDVMWHNLTSMKVQHAGVFLADFLEMMASWHNLEFLFLENCYLEDPTVSLPVRGHKLTAPPKLKRVRLQALDGMDWGALLLFAFLCELVHRLASPPRIRYETRWEASFGEEGVDCLLGPDGETWGLLSLLSTSRVIGLTTDPWGWTLVGGWDDGGNVTVTCEHLINKDDEMSAARYLHGRLANNYYSNMKDLGVHGIDDSFPITDLLLSMPYLQSIALGCLCPNASNVLQQLFSTGYSLRLHPCLDGLQHPENQEALLDAVNALRDHGTCAPGHLLYLLFDEEMSLTLDDTKLRIEWRHAA